MKGSGSMRTDSNRIRVYNDGLRVYLYDPANTAAILGSVPEDNDYPLDEENLQQAARQQLIVLYELAGDDELDIEVTVGRRLTRKECDAFGCSETAETYLHVPSGQLRIDSANSLLLVPDEADADGAVVAVPPGDYRVTVHRRADREDEDTVAAAGRAAQFISLSPAPKSRPRNNTAVLLFADEEALDRIANPPGRRDTLEPQREGVSNGVFHGSIQFGNNQMFFINLTRQDAGLLGIDPQRDFIVEVPALDLRIVTRILDVPFFTRTSGFLGHDADALDAIGPEVATGNMKSAEGEERCMFTTHKRTAVIPEDHEFRWLEVRIYPRD